MLHIYIVGQILKTKFHTYYLNLSWLVSRNILLKAQGRYIFYIFFCLCIVQKINKCQYQRRLNMFMHIFVIFCDRFMKLLIEYTIVYINLNYSYEDEFNILIKYIQRVCNIEVIKNTPVNHFSLTVYWTSYNKSKGMFYNFVKEC